MRERAGACPVLRYGGEGDKPQYLIMTLDIETLRDSDAAGRIAAVIDHLRSIPDAERPDAIESIQRGLSEADAAALAYHWPIHARDSQLPPDDDWDTWLILAGRGFGKTRTGAEWIRDQVEHYDAKRVALVARTIDEAQSVMIEGESGIIAVSPAWNKPTYEPSKRKLTWPNGARAFVFSSHEPDQLRGPQFDAAWCDELAAWEYPDQTWKNLTFTLRLNDQPRAVITTTPKPIDIIRSLPHRPGVFVTRGSTYENRAVLPPAFMNAIIEQFEGTRLGKQEIDAELTDEDEGALWKREWIEKHRRWEPPSYMARIVVAVDPALSANRNSSETGIIVAGSDKYREAYVLADESARLSPNSWARRVIQLYDKFEASAIIVEDNAGGDMVRATISNATERRLPIKKIRARIGKYARAEPVASLYEQGKVHHVGNFPELEEQMCTWTPDMVASRSPDRTDALVYAITNLIQQRRPLFYSL